MGEILNEKCFRKVFHFVPSHLIGSGEDKYEHKDEKKYIYYQNMEKNCVYFLYSKNVAGTL